MKKIGKKHKRGVSLMVGYVLLVTLAIVMGIITYSWIKTYVPKSALECPDGISISVRESNFNESTSKLELTLKNNGRFDVNGYFIYGTNSSSQELATIDLSQYFNQSSGGSLLGSSVMFLTVDGGVLKTGKQVTHVFDIPPSLGKIYSVNIIPTRVEKEENKERFVSCGSSGTRQNVGEPGASEIQECVPNCLGKECGSDGCGGSCGTCSGGDVCDGTGQCVPPAQCTDTCQSLNYACGTQTICGQSVNCGTCQTGFSCNTTGQCVSSCGNGIIDSGEQCDDGNSANSDGCSSTCQVEGGWQCTGQPSVCLQGGNGGSFNSCGDYCDTFQGYSAVFACVQNPNQCGSSRTYIGNIPGANETYGNSLCGTDTNADTCCCTPG